MKKAITIHLGTLLMLLAGCGKSEKQAEAQTSLEPLSVYTVNYPLTYFAERIGGERVAVEFPAPADEDPAYWDPPADVIAAYQKADLILLNGADYAKWIKKVSMPPSKLVNTSRSFPDALIPLHAGPLHSHGPGGDHSHGGVAFTTWLDPLLAIEQARTIKDVFCTKRPEYAAEISARFSRLEQELLAIDKQLKAITSNAPERPVLFSHPVFQYLEKRYGLHGKSVHWEPDQEFTQAMLEDLEKIRSSHPAQWMIWEGAPSADAVRKLEKIGVESCVFNPCGNTPDEGDYLSVLQENISELSQVYKQ